MRCKLVQFNNTIVNPSTTDRTFSIQVDDGGGVNNLASATATVTVGSVNHAPQVTVPGTSVTVAEDGSLTLDRCDGHRCGRHGHPDRDD